MKLFKMPKVPGPQQMMNPLLNAVTLRKHSTMGFEDPNPVSSYDPRMQSFGLGKGNALGNQQVPQIENPMQSAIRNKRFGLTSAFGGMK